MLSRFVIHEPRAPEEASELLSAFSWDATPYAGGTELLLVMKEGLTSFSHLINVKTIAGLGTLELTGNNATLRVGSAVTHRAIEKSPLVARHAPLLVEMERSLANVRVRSAGTLAGNLCFAEPHSDPATVCMGWPGVVFELTSTDGVRRLTPDEFFLDLFLTARQSHELMAAIEFPVLPPGAGGAYGKFVLLERPSASVAAFLTVAGGKIQSASLAVGSVGPVPFRASAAEALLVGEEPRPDLYHAAAEAAADVADPVADLYGSADYKRQLVRVLTRRTLQQAYQRAVEGEGM